MEEDQQLAKVVAEMPNIIQELTLMQGIKTYFSALRQSRGHNPEGSPIDLEVLLLLKLVLNSVENPVQTLYNIGLIIVGDEIAINANYLRMYLSTCRSRINNSMKHLGWNTANHNNTEKFELLSPLVERKDARNWTIRTINPNSAVYSYINENPQLRLRSSVTQPTTELTMSLGSIVLDGANIDDGTGPQFKKEEPSHDDMSFQ